MGQRWAIFWACCGSCRRPINVAVAGIAIMMVTN